MGCVLTYTSFEYSDVYLDIHFTGMQWFVFTSTSLGTIVGALTHFPEVQWFVFWYIYFTWVQWCVSWHTLYCNGCVYFDIHFTESYVYLNIHWEYSCLCIDIHFIGLQWSAFKWDHQSWLKFALQRTKLQRTGMVFIITLIFVEFHLKLLALRGFHSS